MRQTGPRRAALAVVLGTLLVLVTTSVAWATEFPPGDEGYHSYTEVGRRHRRRRCGSPGYRVGASRSARATRAASCGPPKSPTTSTSTRPEPEVLFDGGTHADEHMSVEMTLHILHWLVDGYGSDARITNIVNTREVWIVFLVNPDGAEYDISGGRFHSWRKNRQPTPGTTAIGTDLNRNFGYRWGGGGRTSSDPYDQHIPRTGRVLRARDPGDAGLPGQPRRRRPSADPGGHHVPRERPAGDVALRLHHTERPSRHDRPRTTPHS